MRVIVDFTLIPIGSDLSLSPYIAACQRIFEARGLEHQLHASGTNIAGEWNEVMDAIRTCHEQVHAMGAVRIASTVKIGTRTDKQSTLAERIDSVTEKLQG